MSRKPIIAGNWKMNLSVSEGVELAAAIRDRGSRHRDVDIVVAPQAMMLWPVIRRLEDSPINVAAQNCHWAERGAYTGEMAPMQLKQAGCAYVIVGHSERRQYFGETDEGVAKKLRALHDCGLTPIMCIGETLEQREAGQTLAVISSQVDAGLSQLTPDEVADTVIAYEPIWAIGTGRTATPEQAQDVHAHIRNQISRQVSETVAQRVRIQYGGSVKPNNIRDLMAQNDIDGALVGGASLKADSFVQLIGYKEASDQ